VGWASIAPTDVSAWIASDRVSTEPIGYVPPAEYEAAYFRQLADSTALDSPIEAPGAARSHDRQGVQGGCKHPPGSTLGQEATTAASALGWRAHRLRRFARKIKNILDRRRG